ncbi:MAG: transglutaminase domain-containing protein [Gammaproteobacteria bacterium]|nr:transglutaminase domain-containing protein [Gammaproteobacteria bacterium]
MSLRPPPFALAAALLVWGVQTAHLPSALGMAAVLEGARLVRWRWDISDADFNRIADFSSLGFLLLVVYQFSNRGLHGIYVLLELAPYVLFLLMVAQAYSRRGRLRMSALFVSLRRRPDEPAHADDRDVDLGYAYALGCLVAAAAGVRGPFFLPAACVVLAWLLWPVRPRRFGRGTWLATLGLAVSLGYAGQLGVREMQQVLERAALALLGDFMWADTDPDRTTTAIGEIGRLKLSDRIRIRVRPLGGSLPRPLLLREAAYDSFEFGNWKTSASGFTAIDALPGTRTWPLANAASAKTAVLVSLPFRRELSITPLPYGSVRVTAPQGLELKHNVYGAVTLEIPPGQVHYRVDFAADAPNGAPARTPDRVLPGAYADDFTLIAYELGLPGKPATEVIERIRAFFARDFRYSLVQRGTWPGRMPLTHFLRRDRKGHCEYFASATVLLLRAGGVPARYAVGYAVNEWSGLERQYIARARHAHAWAEAWVGDRWQVVDTTPAVWAEREQENASVIEPLLDAWSWLAYRIDRIRAGESGLEDYYPVALAALIALLAWRLSRRPRFERAADIAPADRVRPGVGLDSEFTALVARLDALGYKLRPGEPLGAWLRRLRSTQADLPVLAHLHELMLLHYRLRFDPQGLDAEARRRLRDTVASRLAELG